MQGDVGGLAAIAGVAWAVLVLLGVAMIDGKLAAIRRELRRLNGSIERQAAGRMGPPETRRR